MLTRQFAMLHEPPGLWTKATAFGIGLMGAIALNLLIGPRSMARQASAISHPTDVAGSPRAIPAPVPAAVSAPIAAETGPAERASADVAPSADPPLPKAAKHKPGKTTKRHPPKRRAATRR
jgi:hypothetical protein